MNVTLVIYPSDAELANTIGDTQTLDKVSLLELRVLVVLFLDGGKYLTYGLDVLRLVGKSLFQILYNFYFLISVAKLKQKQRTTKHFVTFFIENLTFCHLIDLNQENVAKQPRFVVHDNKEICLSLCPITKKCRSLGGERQFFFFLYLIYMYGTSWL